MNKFDFESAFVELVDCAAKVNAALVDLGEWYFDALVDEKDARMFKHFFSAGKVRKEMADDYARKLESIAKTIDDEYLKVLRGRAAFV